MKRIRYDSLAFAFLLVAATVGLTAGVALATPNPNGAVLLPRVFNDCPATGLVANNAYPASIMFEETNLVCAGGQNMHLWNFSEDGGATSAVFNNKDAFRFATTLDLSPGGGGGMEGGLRVSPWWDQNANGYFNVRLPDGEIACFGGVLPFYSFSAAHGLRYGGGPIRLGIHYDPHCNSKDDRGTIEYLVSYRGVDYASGPLPFDNCTPGEEAHGCYGIMDDARVGGRAVSFFPVGDPSGTNTASFFDAVFEVLPPTPDCPVPVHESSWGRVKGIYR